jgi:hypothetical protein
LGQFVADGDFSRCFREIQSLQVRVDGYEIDVFEIGGNHPVYGVAPASPDSDDFDGRQGWRPFFEELDIHVPLPFGSLFFL